MLPTETPSNNDGGNAPIREMEEILTNKRWRKKYFEAKTDIIYL